VVVEEVVLLNQITVVAEVEAEVSVKVKHLQLHILLHQVVLLHQMVYQFQHKHILSQ
jgi:hypothetical protein